MDSEIIMKDKKQIIITTLFCLLPSAAGFLLWNRLPEQVPVHYGFDGQPDGYSSRITAVLMLPVLMAAVNLFVHFMLSLDPSSRDGGNERIIRAAGWLVPLISLFSELMILLPSLGVNVSPSSVLSAEAGTIFALAGRYLPDTAVSRTVGFRLPWTLNSAENWKRTHILAGKIWTLAGLFLLIAALTDHNVSALTVSAVIFAAAAVPSLYSYYLYRKGC